MNNECIFILPLIYPSNNPSICLPGARVYQDADHSGQDAASLQRGSARPASFQREHRVRPFWYAANAGVWQIAQSHGLIQGVQEKLCDFRIHCNPSLAYIAVRDLQSSQRNASVQWLLLAGNFLYNQ